MSRGLAMSFAFGQFRLYNLPWKKHSPLLYPCVIKENTDLLAYIFKDLEAWPQAVCTSANKITLKVKNITQSLVAFSNNWFKWFLSPYLFWTKEKKGNKPGVSTPVPLTLTCTHTWAMEDSNKDTPGYLIFYTSWLSHSPKPHHNT